ncbi:MAG: hypothetical protein HKM28_01225 [Flavobacteriaceae bacterium]|nr:hypothetical protein [Flavobacteriaceae bacterium]
MRDLRSTTDRSKFNLLPTPLRSFIGICILMILLVSCSKDAIESEPVNLTQDDSLRMGMPVDTWQEQVAVLDRRMRRFHNFQVAQAQGYNLLVSPYVPQMGYHYLNPNRVNGEFNLLEPELLVYHPDEDGNMVLGAAEYLVPVDLNNPPPPPAGFIGEEDEWELNPNAGGWTLHVWIGVDNPDGIFAPYNPAVPVSPPGN